MVFFVKIHVFLTSKRVPNQEDVPFPGTHVSKLAPEPTRGAHSDRKVGPKVAHYVF